MVTQQSIRLNLYIAFLDTKSPLTIQLNDLHLGRSAQHYIFTIQEDTKVGVTLNNQTGLPPPVFTKARKEYFRGLFRIVLMDAFKGPELAKIKALISSMSIDFFPLK